MPSPRLFLALLASALIATTAVSAPDLTRIADDTAWQVINRSATAATEGARQIVRLDARAKDGLVWLVGSDFAEGTLEVDLRGSNTPGQSFVGLAFHGADEKNYDAVYFRPFNFKNTDPARRLRAVQYISHPSFPWEKLRADFPGKYEQPVSPVPDPDGWFHARIVITHGEVSVFVDDATTPSLVVTALTPRRSGLIGLWVGNGSAGDFANLKITPSAP